MLFDKNNEIGEHPSTQAMHTTHLDAFTKLSDPGEPFELSSPRLTSELSLLSAVATPFTHAQQSPFHIVPFPKGKFPFVACKFMGAVTGSISTTT
uniref:Uncharacterized protein n=1 Tax=Steinernema glaseri TaxID=37863 RepID=A0A1I8AAG2_9BILA